jgi:hypothetical protein
VNRDGLAAARVPRVKMAEKLKRVTSFMARMERVWVGTGASTRKESANELSEWRNKGSGDGLAWRIAGS